MNDIRTLKIGTEFILEATSFTQPKNIEKSAPSIQWTITPKGGSSENIGTGKAINYKVTDKYAGKTITFRAFIKENSKETYPQQCITCLVEGEASAKYKSLFKGSTGEQYAPYFDEECDSRRGLYGKSNGIPSKEVVVLRPGLQDSTVAHELFHALGLSHSFSNNSKYTFEKNKTDNIMDYSDMNGIPVIASWQFQWELVQKDLSKDD
jgi:hypothetical protein